MAIKYVYNNNNNKIEKYRYKSPVSSTGAWLAGKQSPRLRRKYRGIDSPSIAQFRMQNRMAIIFFLSIFFGFVFVCPLRKWARMYWMICTILLCVCICMKRYIHIVIWLVYASVHEVICTHPVGVCRVCDCALRWSYTPFSATWHKPRRTHNWYHTVVYCIVWYGYGYAMHAIYSDIIIQRILSVADRRGFHVPGPSISICIPECYYVHQGYTPCICSCVCVLFGVGTK